jgi:hypothetical protein
LQYLLGILYAFRIIVVDEGRKEIAIKHEEILSKQRAERK